MPHTVRSARRRGRRRLLTLAATAVLATTLVTAPGYAAYTPGIPAAVDPGDPTFAGSSTPVPAPPVAYDPSTSMLQAIFNADVAAGGTSYWMDRILARPFLSSDSTSLYTRGRGLYMYTHTPGTLGFAGGYAYRERPTGASQNLYTVSISGVTLTENTAQRVQFPSYYTSVFTATGLSVTEKKFITDNNVAITSLTLNNTGSSSATWTVTATSPIATTASGSELTGTVSARYALTTMRPRFSGDSFTVSGTNLTRTVTVGAGASVTMKVQLGMLTDEMPESSADYSRYRAMDANTAWLTQMREYNQFWVDNVNYLDFPDKNLEKLYYYRTWENRFDEFDGDIPGNDYQFPVDLEGALGYNNQISLTVPMREQDLEYWRNPLYPYGSWLSQGEESGCQAYHDNPGNTANWNNTYEQWTSAQAWKSYLVAGGPTSIVANMAKYSECDVKGTLAKFDTNGNNLIEYSSGTLPGNDADSVAFAFFGTRPQDRTDSSFVYANAQASAAEYNLIGNTTKANQMSTIASNVKNSILTNLWASGPVGGGGGATGPRVTGKLGNAVKLSGNSEYVALPTGIVSGLSNFTISAWVNPAAGSTWSRVFDFGTGTTTNMFLTVSAGTAPRFAITTSGSGGEQRLSATSALPLNTWSHLAVTLSGSTGTLYVNGVAVATNTGMTLHPSSLGSTTNNWIGRSQYADPYLNATVDDFQIYNSALTAAQVASLAGGAQGAGNVASYRFDEASGATANDSSGNGRTATINSPGGSGPNSCPGLAFLQRDLTSGSLVCWKDQQNFTPFIDGIPPDTSTYTQALRYYADKAEFPIMPAYTADQADKAAATAFGNPGSNNFSNINATLQARLYSTALRNYPTQFITADSYRKLIEWLSWNEDINGDNRFPDNNEFFSNWNPTNKTLTRSSIHHDLLGSYTWMYVEDIAGLQARLDNTLELYPIDMGYDHFTINNLRYHGSDLTIVWQKPGGTTFYPNAPAGYSVYLNGQRAFTVSDLAHVSWNSSTGAVSVLDGSATTTSFSTSLPLLAATQVSLSGNARMVDAFQKAGVDLTATGADPDLALNKATSASFTTTSPAASATATANAVDGFTISGLPVTSGSYVGTNPIWGDSGTPNASDWFQIDLGAQTRFNTVKLYFYDNKAFGSGGSTYSPPTSYSVQIFNGSAWVDISGQVKSPSTPAPNYNLVTFTPVTAQLVRVMMTHASGRGVGLKEVQIQSTS